MVNPPPSPVKIAYWMQLLWVGAGGFLGSALRYALGGFVHRLFPQSTFPYGTLVVNLLGCLGIGVLAGLAESRQAIGPEMRLFLLVGLLGGFTTFSTLGNETYMLIRNAETQKAFASMLLHVTAGVGAAWFGHALVRWF